MRLLKSDYGLTIEMNQKNLIHLAHCLLVLAEENDVKSITKLAKTTYGICQVDFVRERENRLTKKHR